MRHRTWSVTVVALLLLGGGVALLGLDWRGHEEQPGAWRDGVSLRQWVIAWTLVGGAGLATAPWLPAVLPRLAALAPLLLWFAFMLRESTLGPIAWVIYGTPTLLGFLLGGLIGDLARRWGHRA